MRSIARVLCALSGTLSLLGAGTLAHADDESHATTIRLVERAVDVTFQDSGTPGPSIGDRIVFTSDLFDLEDHKVGRDGADCVIVRIDAAAPPAEQQIVQCLISVELPRGQITFQGLAQGTENFFAVTGGTGAYRAARGQAFAKDITPLVEAQITITLVH